MSEIYEVFAIKYGSRANRTRADSFILDPYPNVVHPIDYYVWVIRNENRTILVDTGFDAASAARLGRSPFDDPPTMIEAFGIPPEAVETLILTHLHFDHAGSIHRFPNAHLHLQAADLAYATGPMMAYDFLRYPFEAEIIADVARMVQQKRATLWEGDATFAPGITLHRLDGHCVGQQGIRVMTKRGAVLLATDAVPWAEFFLDYRLSPILVDARDMLRSYDRVRELAESEDHVIAGHDPLVAALYPRVPGLEAPVYALHEAPSRTIREAVAAEMPKG